MRILFISAFYPPHIIGGWDQLVEEMNAQLRARGHITQVLTSQHGVLPGEPPQEGISRTLILENDLYHYRPQDFFFKRGRIHRANIAILKEQIASFQPDVIFVHGMWLLWKGIPWAAELLLPGRVVYFVADNWPYSHTIHESYWRLPANRPMFATLKDQLARFPLWLLAREERKYRPGFQHVLCVSQTVKENLVQHLGLPPEQLQVVHNGIELDQFIRQEKRPGRETLLSLLYAGNVTVEKGVHTAIEAMHILSRQPLGRGVRLTILGSGHPDYEAYLKSLVDQYELGNQVLFQGRVPRLEMPQVFRQHDVLVFPSTGEALPRVVQEAMASGLVVIGTTAGGTGEILIEGETGLTFLPEDAAGLARQIERLLQDDELFTRLQDRAQVFILRQFDMQNTVGTIEAYLQRFAQATPSVTRSNANQKQREIEI